MRTRRGPARRGRGATAGDAGWAEIVILLVFAAIIGFAFLWALVLHEKPPRKSKSDSATADSTASTLVPPTLPPPHKYVVVKGGVNLRQGPATNTGLITKLAGGTKVQVVCKTVGEDVTSQDGSSNLWVRIDLGQFGVGYASSLYVDVGDDIDNADRIGDCSLLPKT